MKARPGQQTTPCNKKSSRFHTGTSISSVQRSGAQASKHPPGGARSWTPASREKGGGLIRGSRSIHRFYSGGVSFRKRDVTVQKGRAKVARRFRGESDHKVDSKGRVSIPASFRRVIESYDPEWTEGLLPRLIIVYGGITRDHLEGFTIEAMDEVDAKISKHPRGSAKRKAMERLYSAQSIETVVDETGRIVLPVKLRTKLGLNGTALFVSSGDTFEIWQPETYDASIAALTDDGFDPDIDPSVYLDGDIE
jgi:MraZ protein